MVDKRKFRYCVDDIYYRHGVVADANHRSEIANAFANHEEELVMTAFLHDVFEDTNCTEEELLSSIQNEFPDIDVDLLQRVIANVVILTHTDDDTYDQYIDRVRQYDVPRLVKLSDIASNIGRIHELGTEKWKELAEKYVPNITTLVSDPMTDREMLVLMRQNPTAFSFIWSYQKTMSNIVNIR